MKHIGAILILLLAATPIEANVITAASCSRANVQTALDAATSVTTQINIPAGTCHWDTSEMVFNMPANIGDIAIIAAGSLTATGGPGATVIVDDYATASDALWAVYQNDSNTTRVVRIAGFTIQTGTGARKNQGYIKFDGSVVSQVRVDHNTFNATDGTVPFRIYGAYGVADHNIFTTGLNISLAGPTNSYGDAQWAAATGLGTANFFFIEDNSMTVFGAINDCDHGGRFVIRYNTLPGGQTHPTGGAGRARGCRAWEFYGNTYQNVVGQDFNAAFISSGTGVFWGNTIGSEYENVITLHSMRKNDATYSETATPNGWGYCGTSSGLPGAGSNWDENTSAVTGYRCFDQPGSGQGDLLAGEFDPVAANGVKNQATGCDSASACAYPRQALEPVYEWLNTALIATYSVAAAFTSVLVENRDYYAHTGSFTGATGVGSGLFAGRPATCTTKVAYWATDVRTLYQCSSTNIWTTYYTPYTYPHPLTCGHTDGTPCTAATYPATLRGGLTIRGGVTIR